MKRTVMLFSVIGCMVLTGCETFEQFALKKPTARIHAVQFGEISLNSAQLIFDVEVDNPYSVALPLTGLDYVLSSGNTPLLAGKTELHTSIPAKGKQSMPLPVTVNYLEMFKSARDIRPGTTIPYRAGVNLSMDAPVLGALTLPLNKEGELALPNASGADILNLLNRLKR